MSLLRIIAGYLMKVKTVGVKIHVFIRRRQDHGHCHFVGNEIVTSCFYLFPCGIPIGARNRQMPADNRLLANKDGTVTPSKGTVIGQWTRKLTPAASDFLHFATIQKELPIRQQPHREGSKANDYRNNEEIQLRTSSNVSSTENRTDSLKRFFTRQYPLQMKSAGFPDGLLAVFASQRKIVSRRFAGNVLPLKKVPPVYTEAA